MATSNSGAPQMTASAFTHTSLLSLSSSLLVGGCFSVRKAPLPSPAPCLLPSPSSPSSFLLSSCIWVSEERIASHALPFPLICKQAPSNYVSPEALYARVFKFYSLPGGSQTPDLGVLPRCRTMIAESDIYQSQLMCRCIRVACSADQATEMWVYPTFTC